MRGLISLVSSCGLQTELVLIQADQDIHLKITIHMGLLSNDHVLSYIKTLLFMGTKEHWCGIENIEVLVRQFVNS